MLVHPARLNYYQYLFVNPIKHTITNFADHAENMNLDALTLFLWDVKITLRFVWDNVGVELDCGAANKLGSVRRHDH